MGNAMAHLTGTDHSDILNIRYHGLSDRCEVAALGFGSVNFQKFVAVLRWTAVRSHRRSRKIATWSTFHLVEFRRQFRQCLVEIRHQTVVGNLKDRRLLI